MLLFLYMSPVSSQLSDNLLLSLHIYLKLLKYMYNDIISQLFQSWGSKDCGTGGGLMFWSSKWPRTLIMTPEKWSPLHSGHTLPSPSPWVYHTGQIANQLAQRHMNTHMRRFEFQKKTKKNLSMCRNNCCTNDPKTSYHFLPCFHKNAF